MGGRGHPHKEGIPVEYSGTRESGVPLETAWCQALEAKENKHMEQRVEKKRGSLQGALVKLPEETQGAGSGCR